MRRHADCGCVGQQVGGFPVSSELWALESQACVSMCAVEPDGRRSYARVETDASGVSHSRDSFKKERDARRRSGPDAGGESVENAPLYTIPRGGVQRKFLGQWAKGKDQGWEEDIPGAPV